ncbi:MAG: hypothetical protein MZU84_00445 [Sphingobacterium sp.]|nr:hypothetical protein [Sphingobacterium sp.]
MLSLKSHFLERKKHFTENFEGNINPTEVVANLICEKDSFVEGIENVFENIKGSCSLMILTDEGIIAARDKLGQNAGCNWQEERMPMLLHQNHALFQIPALKLTIFWVPERLFTLTADGLQAAQKAGGENADMFFSVGLLWLSSILL